MLLYLYVFDLYLAIKQTILPLIYGLINGSFSLSFSRMHILFNGSFKSASSSSAAKTYCRKVFVRSDTKLLLASVSGPLAPVSGYVSSVYLKKKLSCATAKLMALQVTHVFRSSLFFQQTFGLFSWLLAPR